MHQRDRQVYMTTEEREARLQQMCDRLVSQTIYEERAGGQATVDACLPVSSTGIRNAAETDCRREREDEGGGE